MFKLLLYLPCIFSKTIQKVSEKTFIFSYLRYKAPFIVKTNLFQETEKHGEQSANPIILCSLPQLNPNPLFQICQNNLPNEPNFNQNSTELTDCRSNITVCNRCIVQNITQNPYAIYPQFFRPFQSVN